MNGPGGRLDALILGGSPAAARLRAEIEAIARLPLRSLLVVGETGVGKDLVPRALVECIWGGRAPLEVFHCPAVPADHLESELFGTTRSAYPGAADRPGAAERADGGLLFLDEIAAMPLSHQAKVLRLLESREGRRLGAARGYRVRAAIVAATNEDLGALVHTGRFRADLYHRLVQDGVLRVPPLRERAEDLGVLARAFLEELPVPAWLASDALSALRVYRWPGNVRELRAVIRTAARLARGGRIDASAVGEALRRVGVPQLPSPAAGPEGALPGSFHASTDGLRRQLLIDALARAGGNQTLAGLLLGLHGRSGRFLAGAPAPADADLLARKRAHRKFAYWWQRLVGPSVVAEAGAHAPEWALATEQAAVK